MEINTELEKNRLYRYFQSFHSLPKNNCILTMEQLDKKIMVESNNLFSLFQLVIYLKNQHVSSDKPFHIFRRLMTLIFCIMQHYKLYLSKIKTLINFWWEAGIQIIENIKYQDKQERQVNKQFFSFIQKSARDQYFFHIFRCFNSILQKFSHNVQKKQSILINDPRISQYLQSSISKFKLAVFYNKYQSEYKILMTFQYCKLLIMSFYYRKNNSKIMILFNEFCQSIMQLIRLMKKFYRFSIIQYRTSLKSIMENGYKVFSSLIPYHKNKLLKSILSYLNRSEKQKQIQKQVPMCLGERRSLIILSRSLNNWKFTYEKKFTKNINQIDLPIKNNSKSQKLTQLPKLTSIFKQKIEYINKGISQLKKKKSESLRIKGQINQNQFQIKMIVQNQIQKQFSRINYLKNRSYSTTIHKKQNNKILSNEKSKRLELKLEDYKYKRWQQQIKRKQNNKVKLKIKIR